MLELYCYLLFLLFYWWCWLIMYYWLLESPLAGAHSISYLFPFIHISLLLFIAFSLINLILFFICYELIIITLFLLLLLFIPSYYRVRTSFFFFLFSIVGSIFFIISCILFVTNSFILLLVLVIPFLIKLPCFLFIIDYQKYIVKLIHQYHYYLLVYY